MVWVVFPLIKEAATPVYAALTKMSLDLLASESSSLGDPLPHASAGPGDVCQHIQLQKTHR